MKWFDIIISVLASALRAPVQFVDPVQFFRLLGIAFGPEGMQHFSELPQQEQREMLERAPILKGKHDDWPEPFKGIKRSCTAWTMPDHWPVMAGTSPDTAIPPRGTWLVKRGYLAMTTEDGWHLRLGFRPDDVDGYVSFPSFTFKKV